MTAKHVARHSATGDRKRAAWRPLAMATIGGAVLVTTRAGVWATLSATSANVDPRQVTSGTLRLTMAANGSGFTQADGADPRQFPVPGVRVRHRPMRPRFPGALHR